MLEPNVEDEGWKLELSAKVEDGTLEDEIVLELKTVEELLRTLLLDRTPELLRTELLRELLTASVEETLVDPRTEDDETMDEV